MRSITCIVGNAAVEEVSIHFANGMRIVFVRVQKNVLPFELHNIVS
jgi:hypothetical protein